MGQKLKIAGWISLGAIAGALTTVQLQAVARNNFSPLPLEELQQLAAVFSMVKSDYVDPVDDKKLISEAISGMVASLDPHSAYFDKKTFQEFREGTTCRLYQSDAADDLPRGDHWSSGADLKSTKTTQNTRGGKR